MNHRALLETNSENQFFAFVRQFLPKECLRKWTFQVAAIAHTAQLKEYDLLIVDHCFTPPDREVLPAAVPVLVFRNLEENLVEVEMIEPDGWSYTQTLDLEDALDDDRLAVALAQIMEGSARLNFFRHWVSTQGSSISTS